MTKHTVKRISEDEREYRGFTIHVNPEVNPDYYGRYIVGSFCKGRGFSRLSEAKAFIDFQIDGTK